MEGDKDVQTDRLTDYESERRRIMVLNHEFIKSCGKFSFALFTRLRTHFIPLR